MVLLEDFSAIVVALEYGEFTISRLLGFHESEADTSLPL
jgi:hypothetical protein